MLVRRNLITSLVLSAGLAAAIGSSGCATVVALDIPGPVFDNQISLGMHRSEVEVVLKHAKRSEFPEPPGTTVRYDYGNGPHQASKGRIVLYLAGDVFTLFLSELVFWPIELYAKGRTERVATAYYDASNRLGMLTIARPGGQDVFVAMGERPPIGSPSGPASDPQINSPSQSASTPPVSASPSDLPNPAIDDQINLTSPEPDLNPGDDENPAQEVANESAQ